MKILYAASEALPYIASGGLADVAGSLPRALNEAGHDCRVVMPLYSGIKWELRESLEYMTNFFVPVAWRNQYCGVFKGVRNGVTYYLLDNEYYFKRNGIYGHYDDAERFTFFSRAILEMLKHIDFKPDILNCNDWQTALVPVYYSIFYRGVPELSGIKTVFTIHNIQYQGKYGMELCSEILGLPNYSYNIVEYEGCVNFMKGAFETADKITTVSPTYASEILNPYFSHGLDPILWSKQYKLTGFLNGIDLDVYNPATDPALPENFSAESPDGKAVCKTALLEEMGLPDGQEPVMGIVTRLVSHKGVDLIRRVFNEMVGLGYKFVILGSGERQYEDFFREMAWKYPDRVSVRIGFIPDLAHRIYAGADMFLMPSQSEPCGLAQMVSLRYGTIPIVRETGGLKDSIIDCGGGDGNGFTFKTYNAHDMLDATVRARALYDNKEAWAGLVDHAFKEDFSWARSAELYLGLYRELCGE
ncbi:MAG TPA: glycogen synthase GlgA [Candidatus Faeciplasma avium]|mgnify:CR=1 FL=1|uniref:Glycogen synthase n=1 Tax=Candidatus Faeciplasma avium TaxID=2840798 RepID=A0A9D1NPX1_9FIRM|nr:glycogen synthase GlgA [Candidatus Faeciplasma avium]